MFRIKVKVAAACLFINYERIVQSVSIEQECARSYVSPDFFPVPVCIYLQSSSRSEIISSLLLPSPRAEKLMLKQNMHSQIWQCAKKKRFVLGSRYKFLVTTSR